MIRTRLVVIEQKTGIHRRVLVDERGNVGFQSLGDLLPNPEDILLLDEASDMAYVAVAMNAVKHEPGSRTPQRR